MTKLPVGKTVAAAYTFTLNNLGAIIGLIWIPMLVLTVVGFFAQSTYIDAMVLYLGTKNASALGPGFMWMLVFIFVAFLANAMMLVPVLQQALGKRKGLALYHFSLGAAEWRMFGAYLALLGIALAFAIVAALVEGLVLKALQMSGQASTPMLEIALNVSLAGVFIVLLVVIIRLAFFIPAVTLLEEKIDIGRGWALGRGNTLRILATILLIAIPVVVLYLGLEMAVFGPAAVLPDLSGAGAATPPSIEELRATQKSMPITEAIGFFLAPLTVGLNAGVVAAAYRALTASPPPPDTAAQ